MAIARTPSGKSKAIVIAGIAVVALVIVAIVAWPRFTEKVLTGDPNTATEIATEERRSEVPPPEFGAVETAKPMLVNLPDGATNEAKELIDAYSQFAYIPSSKHLQLSTSAALRTSKSGLEEVRRLIVPGSEDEFIGILNNEDFLYPGRVVSLTPIARPDYDLDVEKLSGFALTDFNVYVASVTPSGDVQKDKKGNTINFGEAKLRPGQQDAQAKDYEQFLQLTQANGARYSSNGNTVFLVKTAHALDEGYQKLGINAKYGMSSVSFSTQAEHRNEQRHLFLMLKQEYFRVRHSPSESQTGNVLTTMIQPTADNVQLMQELAQWRRTPQGGIPYQSVPGMINSVTYGRIILAASETASYSDEEIARFAAKYANPSSEISTEFQNQLKTLLNRSTFKLVSWGGGHAGLPAGLVEGVAKDKVEHADVVDLFFKTAGEKAKWSSEHPGRPIGFTAYYLDQKGTQAISYSISDKNLLADRGGFFTDLLFSFNCGDDRDGAFSGDGEFKFNLTVPSDPNIKNLDLGSKGIDDGAAKPQWQGRIRYDFNYRAPFSLNVHTTEEDDFLNGANDESDFPVTFEEAALKPVPDSYTIFSSNELKTLTDVIQGIVSDYHDLRKLGDIHKISEQEATAIGKSSPEFKAAWDVATAKVAKIIKDHSDAKTQLDAARKTWNERIVPDLRSHRVSAESPVVEKSTIRVELIPHSTLTIETVNGMFEALNQSLDNVKKGL